MPKWFAAVTVACPKALVLRFLTSMIAPLQRSLAYENESEDVQELAKEVMELLEQKVTAHAGKMAFANAYAAYDALSDRMKTYLDGLTALHDGRDVFGDGTPNAIHPLICRHPETGRKLIYIADSFTKRINEVSWEESDMIIRFLLDHCRRPEWSMRFHWRPHSLAFWDNRCMQHRAISDYLPNVRSGYRVQIEGVAPPVAG